MKEMFRMVDKSKVDEVKQMLEYTQKGTAKATVGNYMVVLRNDPLVRESMKYNKLTGRIDIVKKLWWNEEVCKLDDDGRTYFYYFFERYYKLTSEKCMDKALRIEANSRAYHPICEYLEQLEWDGQERIRYVLQRYMGADASDFVYEVVKHFLMEALSRIYRPGCKADEMLCLVGQQGAGKSTFFRFLALNDDWFSDDLKQLNDSKIYEHLRGHWIMEMSEMIAAISAKSNEEIKSFLTRQHVKGEAADITTGTVEGNKQLFDMICASDISFDQLIDERNFRWLHISCKMGGIGNRRAILHL